MKLPIGLRLRFWVRLRAIESVRALIAIGTWARWPWLVFNLMAFQRRMGWRFER